MLDLPAGNVRPSVSPRNAAQMMGIRLDAVYSLIWAGRLQAEKQDGRWLVSQSAVEAKVHKGKLLKRIKGAAKEHIELTSEKTPPGNL